MAVETCEDPVVFTMDAAVTIQERDARPPSRILSFLGSTRVLPKASTVFTVRLTPPLTRSAKDLWRLDTAEKYVRGEEALGVWKPRGISVVEDYNRLVTMEKRSADVQAVKVVLAASPGNKQAMVVQEGAAVWASEDLMKKALELWQKKFGHPGEVSFEEFRFVVTW